ncbi:alpha/beta fold hydrolase [soil metagenome]
MPTIETSGGELHYTERGVGPVALFVHGFPLDSTLWIEQVERLAGEWRGVTVDLAGFGRSSTVVADVLTMERHADDLAGVVDRIGVDLVDLVGLSMGGYVALAFAERHANRLRTLALVDTKATADDEAAKAGRDAAATRLLEEGRQAFAAGMVGGLLGPDAGPWLRARVRQMIESTRYETIVAALAGMRDRPDRSDVLAATSVPVGVIVGADDALTPPAAAEAMAAMRPDITLDVIPGAGHLAPIEALDAVAAALAAVFDRGGPEAAAAGVQLRQ